MEPPGIEDHETGDGARRAAPAPPAEAFAPPDEADFELRPEDAPLELWRAVGDVPPWATLLTLLAWGVLFMLMAMRREFGDVDALVARGASIARPPALADAWRLLACTFLHAGPAHVAANALSLLVLGPAVERIFTRWGYAIVFAWGGTAASIASLAWRLHLGAPGTSTSIGGSGALFALGASLLVAAWRLRARLAVGRSRAFAAVVMMLTLPGLAAGFQRGGTDNAAHLGGFVAGALLGALAPLNPRLGGRPGAAARVAGGVAALALAAAFVLALRG